MDLLKDGADILLEKLAKLFSVSLNFKGTTSLEKRNLIQIYRKGDVKQLKNYRPISLLSVVYKLFTKVVLNRISGTLDFQQRREQAGFRKG